MKRFKFRLQRILDFRNTLKHEQGSVLAHANTELKTREELLEDILSAQESAYPPSEKLLTMAELALHGEYQETLREALVTQRLLVLEAAHAVDQAREAYIERSREAQALELLRAKRKELHRQEEEKKERKKIDSLVTMRHRLNKDR